MNRAFRQRLTTTEIHIVGQEPRWHVFARGQVYFSGARRPARQWPGTTRFRCRVCVFGSAALRPGSVLWLDRMFRNSLVTGAFLAIATVAVGLLCFRRDIVLLPADYVFLALVLCFLLSSAFNGWTRRSIP